VMLLKMLAPVKRLESARRVEEAAVIVMLEVPSKRVPLMFLPVWRAVAVEALPVTFPVRLPKIPPEAVRTPVIVEEALMVEEAVERKPEVKLVIEEKMFEPEKVLLSARRVEEAVESVAQVKVPPVQVSLLVPVQEESPPPKKLVE
jgi:hypothetical protein